MSTLLEFAFARCEQILLEVDQIDCFIETAHEIERLELAVPDRDTKGDCILSRPVQTTRLTLVV